MKHGEWDGYGEICRKRDGRSAQEEEEVEEEEEEEEEERSKAGMRTSMIKLTEFRVM